MYSLTSPQRDSLWMSSARTQSAPRCARPASLSGRLPSRILNRVELSTKVTEAFQRHVSGVRYESAVQRSVIGFIAQGHTAKLQALFCHLVDQLAHVGRGERPVAKETGR